MLCSDDVVRRAQAKRRDICIFGKPRSGSMLSWQAARRTGDGGYAHGCSNNQNRSLQKFWRNRHHSGHQHEGVQAHSSQAVQRERHHIHQWVCTEDMLTQSRYGAILEYEFNLTTHWTFKSKSYTVKNDIVPGFHHRRFRSLYYSSTPRFTRSLTSK